MKYICKACILFVTVLSFSAMAQSAGTTSFEFLRNQYSPRGAGMGGNLVALKGDIQGILYNPAALAGNASKQWTINYVDHLIDFQGGYLAYSQPYKNWGNLNASIIYFNYGTFDETNEFGDRTGRTFSASETALSLGLSNHLGSGFDYGIGAKFIYSALESYNASGIALDGGLLYTGDALSGIQVGVSLLNLGATIDNYTSYKEKLPIMLQIGAAKRLTHLPLLISASLNDVAASEAKFLDHLKKFSLGGEFDVSEVVRLRLGYQNEINQSVKPLGRNIFGGVSVGLGILWKTFRLDYAFSSFGDLGSQNRLGISGSF